MTAEKGKKETSKTPKKKRVVFEVNVKYGEHLYKRGEGLEVTSEEFETLLASGVIGKGDAD